MIVSGWPWGFTVSVVISLSAFVIVVRLPFESCPNVVV